MSKRKPDTISDERCPECASLMVESGCTNSDCVTCNTSVRAVLKRMEGTLAELKDILGRMGHGDKK